MITFMKLLILMTFVGMTSSSNPMKLSLTLLLTMTASMTLMGEVMGVKWMPMILYMLLMGGILIMFMILASFMPDKKTKPALGKTMLIIMMAPLMSYQVKSMNSVKITKNFTESNLSMATLMTVMIFYFLSFMNLTKLNKMPISM